MQDAPPMFASSPQILCMLPMLVTHALWDAPPREKPKNSARIINLRIK